MINNNFFIKNDYIVNKEAITNDNVSGSNYWDEKRLYGSAFYQYPVYKFAKKIIIKNKIKRVIDVGCGPGTKLNIIKKKLKKVHFIGIDQKNAIDYCKKKYDFGEWYVDNLENPFKSLDWIKGDLVICSDVIEHLQNPDVLMNYLKQKLDFGGYIILSTPERDLLNGKDCTVSPNKQHIREWNYSELKQYFEYHSFKVIEAEIQLPVGWSFNKIFYKEVVRRFMDGKPLKYNQVFLLQKDSR